jgi:hypothetical protein
MLVGLKSLVISRTLGLYGFKFDKLTASVEDFSYLISYNYVDPLQDQDPKYVQVEALTVQQDSFRTFGAAV